MDTELKDYLDNIARSFENRFDDLNAELRDVRAEMRDVREEVRSFKTDLREMSQRISDVGSDYREARQVRDVRAIALESRVNELERRMSELEAGRQ